MLSATLASRPQESRPTPRRALAREETTPPHTRSYILAVHEITTVRKLSCSNRRGAVRWTFYRLSSASFIHLAPAQDSLHQQQTPDTSPVRTLRTFLLYARGGPRKWNTFWLPSLLQYDTRTLPVLCPPSRLLVVHGCSDNTPSHRVLEVRASCQSVT